MTRWRLAVGIPVAVIVAACAIQCSRTWFAGPDAWWHSPAEGGSGYGGPSVAVSFSPVLNHEPEAQKALESVSVVPLSDEDLGYYGVKAESVPPYTRPFLVRGLVGVRGTTGHFKVTLRGDALAVFHGSMGHGWSPGTRQPLVVWLAKEPRDVYVTYEITD
jgi:hypothetical protein